MHRWVLPWKGRKCFLFISHHHLELPSNSKQNFPKIEVILSAYGRDIIVPWYFVKAFRGCRAQRMFVFEFQNFDIETLSRVKKKIVPNYFEQFCLGLSGSFRWWCSQKPMKVKELSLQVASIISGLQPNALLTLSDPLFPTQEMYVLWAISNGENCTGDLSRKGKLLFYLESLEFFFFLSLYLHSLEKIPWLMC